MESIELKSPLPRYYQLAQIIKRQVESQKFKPGSPISSIPSLMKECHVSQSTVRQAIATLVAEDILYTDHGRGTFVCPDHNIMKRTDIIGVLVPDLEQPSIFAEITRAIEEEIYQKDGSLILSHTDNSYQRFKKYIRLYQKKNVDGLIIVPLQSEKYEELNLSILRQVEKASIPYILIDEYLENHPADCVVVNNEKMGYLLTRHLLEQGYRQIAFIAGPYCPTIRDRLNGYRRAIKESGISFNENLVSFSKGRFQEDAYLLAKNLLGGSGRARSALARKKPDAFFGANDTFAFGAFKAVTENGLNVPKDIGLVGFDDSAIASKLKVPLTTVRQPVKKMGEKAVQLLMKRIENPDKKAEKVILPAKLIIRESSVRKV